MARDAVLKAHASECQRLLERLVSAARISARRGFTSFCEKQVGRADPQGRSTQRYRRAQRGGNNYSTAICNLQESYPFNYFLSMKIQECDELIVLELSIVIGWLSQFGDFLRANNLLKIRCYTACK